MTLFIHRLGYVLLIVFCSFLLEGCCYSIHRSARPDVLMPLNVGNWWKGRTTSSASVGTVKTLHVVAVDTTTRDETWYLMNDSSLMSSTASGLRRRISSTFNNTLGHSMLDGILAKEYQLKIPRHVGDTVWSSTFEDSIGSTIRYLGIAEKLDTLICVPAGMFHCFMVTTFVDKPEVKGFSIYYGDGLVAFYARGVGKVKEVYSNGNAVLGSSTIWELVSYQVH